MIYAGLRDRAQAAASSSLRAQARASCARPSPAPAPRRSARRLDAPQAARDRRAASPRQPARSGAALVPSSSSMRATAATTSSNGTRALPTSSRSAGARASTWPPLRLLPTMLTPTGSPPCRPPSPAITTGSTCTATWSTCGQFPRRAAAAWRPYLGRKEWAVFASTISRRGASRCASSAPGFSVDYLRASLSTPVGAAGTRQQVGVGAAAHPAARGDDGRPVMPAHAGVGGRVVVAVRIGEHIDRAL